MGWSTTVVRPAAQRHDRLLLASLRQGGGARVRDALADCHGPPVTDVAPFIAAYKAHRLDRERQILEQLAMGHHRIAEMIPRMYAAVDPRLHPAAANSVLAHMIHLVREGVIATDGPPGPGSAYPPPPPPPLPHNSSFLLSFHSLVIWGLAAWRGLLRKWPAYFKCPEVRRMKPRISATAR